MAGTSLPMTVEGALSNDFSSASRQAHFAVTPHGQVALALQASDLDQLRNACRDDVHRQTNATSLERLKYLADDPCHLELTLVRLGKDQRVKVRFGDR
jgi:hypothetical protein